MTDKKFFEALTEFRGSKEPLHETAATLSYEVGGMLEQAMYLTCRSGYEDERKVRLGLFKSGLMDAIAQTVLICESVGADFEEMKKLGIEKAMERFTREEKK